MQILSKELYKHEGQIARADILFLFFSFLSFFFFFLLFRAKLGAYSSISHLLTYLAHDDSI